jgi:hypothetical protein
VLELALELLLEGDVAELSVEDGLVLPAVPLVVPDAPVDAFDSVKFPLWPAKQPVTVTVFPDVLE